jgi:hypothetical protein
MIKNENLTTLRSIGSILMHEDVIPNLKNELSEYRNAEIEKAVKGYQAELETAMEDAFAEAEKKMAEEYEKNEASETKSEVVTAEDPNEKAGFAGVGDQHYVVGGQELTYTIYFENKETAAAPAQEVFIDDYLDEDLDWSTFKLGEVGFGDQVITSLADEKTGNDRVILEDMAVDIEAHCSPTSGHIRWMFRTIDIETGELPEDAYAGFLPPEDGKGSGQGYVTFSIRTKNDSPAGTLVTNSATIIFDTESPISTNEVFNTITDDAPIASEEPFIANGSKDVKVTTLLNWDKCRYATSYDLFLWESDEDIPEEATAVDLKSPFYDPTSGLEYGTTYYWQVTAKNVMGETESPVWSFTTESIIKGDLYSDREVNLADAIAGLQAISGIDRILNRRADVNDDGRIGLEEAVYALQVVSELK